MPVQNHLTEEGPERAFVIARTFDVTRDVTWKVWTESAHLAHWFGPKTRLDRNARDTALNESLNKSEQDFNSKDIN